MGLKNHPDVWLKPTVFVLCLLPFIGLVFALLTNRLDPNPIEVLTDETGEWALRFIILGLVLTPLRQKLKVSWPVRLRRMIGLYAFFYACIHFLLYLLDSGFSVPAVIEDLYERPYVLAGFIALMIFLPLAITSTRKMTKRLGKRWQLLHRWVYLGATAAIVHYVWLAKGERLEPKVYLVILLALLVIRLIKLLNGKKNTRTPPRPVAGVSD
ncbi:MAG: sulfoxide reductase heme-binding subunit YedZ [Gammaproteobacteria bacterium]|nr:sulfoxide reductase heme-binding subunit YedZ [Gammaproteobacteria bacterium]